MVTENALEALREYVSLKFKCHFGLGYEYERDKLNYCQSLRVKEPMGLLGNTFPLIQPLWVDTNEGQEVPEMRTRAARGVHQQKMKKA